MRDLKWIFLLIVLSFLALILVAPHVSAIGPQETAIPVPAGVIVAPMGNNSAREIQQMGTVYWGETIDMRLVVYGDRRLVHATSGRVVDVSSFTRRILIDPNVFLVGEWDKWSPYEEGAGNNVAFYVEKVKPTPTEVTPTQAGNTTDAAITITSEPPLTRQHVADILIARGDGFTYTVPGVDIGKAWMFGIVDQKLNLPIKNEELTVAPEIVRNMQAETYRLLIETPGNDSVVDADYVPKNNNVNPKTTEHIESVFRRIPLLEIEGLNPQTVYQKFTNWLKTYSNDEITELEVVIQEPKIEITALDTAYSTGDNQTTSSIIVRGYTNLAPGTDIWVIMDENLQTARTLRANTFHSIVFGEEPGDMRQFQIIIPHLDFNDMTTGQHFVTVRSSFDVYSTAPWWNNYIPDGQEAPVMHNKYAGGNLYVPTQPPTVVTQRVEVPVEIIRTVTILPTPMPTPVPPPWFFASPWIYVEAMAALILGAMAGVWILWKVGVL